MAKKVLIIDDEPNIAKMIGSRLEASGYVIATAENGEEGLQQVEKENPDLIILDVLMPVMDGFGFFKTIKKDSQKADIPIIVLTGRGGMKSTFEALDADAFIPKPFEPADLLSKIENCLAKKILVFGDNPAFINVVKKALEKSECQVEVAANDEELFSKGRKTRYNVILAHLALVKKEPADFILLINRLKTKSDKLLLYCDAMVTGAEEGNTVVIADLKTKWERAGIVAFFDPRVSLEKLDKVLSKYIT